MLHKSMPAAERHAPWSWEYADAAAREAATGFVAGDVSKMALQLNDVTAWVLTSHSPILWMPVGGSGGGGGTPLSKTDPTTPCLTKTGAGTIQVNAGTSVLVGTTQVTFATATSVTMPTLVAGTDYAVWVDATGAAQASDSHTTPPVAGAAKIGGFHYAPGGNATAQAGGNTTPAINEYSIWDLKFRPACPDPRGMTLVAGSFWADIYLTGVNHHIDGTSKLGVTIADGLNLPKIPLAFGGNGTTTYATMNWWRTGELLTSHGKRMPDYTEFAALAYGVTEASSIGTDQVTTKLNAAYTSRWGVMQATGVMNIFGRGDGGGQGTAAWTASGGGRGSTWLLPNIPMLGGDWGSGSLCGSHSVNWNNAPSVTASIIGARGVCDHLVML